LTCSTLAGMWAISIRSPDAEGVGALARFIGQSAKEHSLPRSVQTRSVM
jgi:hypothetical protein